MRSSVLVLVFLPKAAWAQTPSAPPPVAVAPPPVAVAPPRDRHGAPEARRGFQMHFVPLTGLLFPFGDASGAPRDSLSGRYSWQWMPLEVGMGVKVIDELYIGGYVNVGIGWEGSDLHTSARCTAGEGVADDVSCSSVSTRFGLEARYTINPAESMAGWVGYGIGITTGSQTISDAGRYSEVSTARGIELARLSAGLDFRFSHAFGMGPFVMVSVGRYTHQTTEIRNLATFSGDIDNTTFHEWVAVGLRMVILP